MDNNNNNNIWLILKRCVILESIKPLVWVDSDPVKTDLFLIILSWEFQSLSHLK